MLTEEVGLSPEQALQAVARSTRDACRTPMQWADAPNAGFSPPNVTTWLQVNPNYAEGVNVAVQEHDSGSLLTFYRRLLAVRRATPALVAGDYAVLAPDAEDYLAFTRSTAAQTVLVVLNFAARPQTVALTMPRSKARVLFSSVLRPSEVDEPAQIEVAPFEVYVAELV